MPRVKTAPTNHTSTQLEADRQIVYCVQLQNKAILQPEVDLSAYSEVCVTVLVRRNIRRANSFRPM